MAVTAKFLKSSVPGQPHQAMFELPADIEDRVKAAEASPVNTGSWSWSTFWQIVQQYGIAIALNVLVIVEDVVAGNYPDIVKQLIAMEPATQAAVLAILAMLGITIPVPTP